MTRETRRGGWLALIALSAAIATGCAGLPKGNTFGEDVAFLRKHTDVVVLKDESGKAQVAVVPKYQGRVMTSAAGGTEGLSYGWINRDLIASGKLLPHMNAFGGEDRFWMGPEGGQYAIFFESGAPFDLEHWQTPAVIDAEPFELTSKSDARAAFRKQTRITSRYGTHFDLRIDRTVRLLPAERAAELLGVSLPKSVRVAAYESDNQITNTGPDPWSKDTGLLSIWILGMFQPTPKTTIVIPFNPGPEGRLGPKINDKYFGKVPAERLIVKDDVLFFRGDGKCRGKIGIPPRRAKPICGSYDAARRVLTLVQYTKPQGAADYVNSMWELQKEPYAGDVVNSYNDGPAGPEGSLLGPFYELETSSPAAALKAQESITHIHRTFHFEGREKDLDAIARKTLGVRLKEIKKAFD